VVGPARHGFLGEWRVSRRGSGTIGGGVLVRASEWSSSSSLCVAFCTLLFFPPELVTRPRPHASLWQARILQLFFFEIQHLLLLNFAAILRSPEGLNEILKFLWQSVRLIGIRIFFVHFVRGLDGSNITFFYSYMLKHEYTFYTLPR
jgi:hypothetical protein